MRHYSIEDGLRTSLVYALHEDEDHALWIGTYGGGLYRLKEGKISSVSKSNGLFDDVIFAILDDSLGSFWMSCNRGIFSASKRDLNDVADGKASTLTCEVFGLNQGLRSVECNGGSQPAAVRTRDGRLLFPTIKGLVAIDPAQTRPGTAAVAVRLEELRVDADRYSLSGVHRLPPGMRTIDFHYTALGADDPAHLQFRYRLDGFENQMVDAGNQRSARYTNVPPGTYTFSVMVRAPGGTWGAPVTSAAVIVPPLIYETWWFRLLSGLLLAGAVGMLFLSVSVRKARRQIEELERDHALERERSRIARDMHDEIGASLTQISILSDLLGSNLRSPETAEPFLRRISSTARDVVGSLDEIVWFINPRHDSLESLLLYIREYVADYLDPLDIECAFAFPKTVPASVLAADVRRNIFLAVKEAVTNIAKHSGATAVTVTASVENGVLQVAITDNGRGLVSPSASPTEDGLKNMEKRLRDIGGDLLLRGQDGAGTSVTLRAPV
jgi:signal transduction histidine kinase